MKKINLRHRKGRCVEYLSESGKWLSTGRNTKEEARLWLMQGGLSKEMTFGEFAYDFFRDEQPGSYRHLQKLTNNHTNPEWWNTKSIHLQCYLMPTFRKMVLTDITPSIVQDWYLCLEGKYKKDLTPNSRRKILDCLNIILDWAVFKGVLSKNPAREIVKIHDDSHGRQAYTDLELARMFPKDMSRLIEIWQTKEWACYFMVMRDTGWRPGEIAGLTPSGLMPEYNAIFTRQSVDSFTKTVKGRIKTSGNGYDYKVGLVEPETMALLLEVASTADPFDVIFKGERNSLLASTTSNKHFKECMYRLGISTEGRPQYSLRTTFMTNAAKTMTREKVEELMGHRQWRSCYDRRTPEDIVRKVLVM